MYIINPHRFGVVNNFVYSVTVLDNETISLPMFNGDDSLYDFKVDFGDGTGEKTVTAYGDADRQHTYVTGGTFDITIPSDGTFDYILFADSPSSIVELKSFGPAGVGSSSFKDCSNFIDFTATDIPSRIHDNILLECFRNADITNVNSSINEWDVSAVINLSRTFQASNFNQSIDGWDVGNVTDMSFTFAQTTSFNLSIDNWNVGNVTTMENLFQGTTVFNQPLNSWNTVNVITFLRLFFGATAFNQPLDNWDFTSASTFQVMFAFATSFNQDIGSWDTSNVGFMSNMFDNATSFNQDIGSWDVTGVATFTNMFNNATSFDQNLGAWNITNMTSAANMFLNVTLSTANYDGILDINTGWPAKSPQNNVPFHGGNSLFTKAPSDAETGRSDLITNHTWTIIDGGPTA